MSPHETSKIHYTHSRIIPKKISFNKPYLTGKETEYIKEAAESLLLFGELIQDRW